jgi:hypothetical protein
LFLLSTKTPSLYVVTTPELKIDTKLVVALNVNGNVVGLLLLKYVDKLVDDVEPPSIEKKDPAPTGILIKLGKKPEFNLNHTHTVTWDFPLKKLFPFGTIIHNHPHHQKQCFPNYLDYMLDHWLMFRYFQNRLNPSMSFLMLDMTIYFHNPN